MADFTALKTAIQTYIKQNGNEEITGEILQEILLSVVTTLGDSAINDLITALADEVAARQNADGTLQQNITNEATARGNADTALSNRLGSTITAENTAADQIGAEAEARAAADTALQELIDGITNNIENGYVYAGIATPSSTPATGKVFYLALTAGTYTNFDNTEVSQGINILKYNGSAWSLDAFIGIDDELTPSSNNLPKSGNVLENIIKNGSAFDLSAYNAEGGVLATYADLDAALTALNALPSVYKQPGMSFRFVQTSDNKYVQYWYFGTDVTGNPNPFLNTDNWLKTDSIPTINAVRNSFIPIKGKVGIIGDSISTYRGTMPSGYPSYYPYSDITSVYETWWNLILSLSGSILDINASWSGSRVTNGRAGEGFPDFYDRTNLFNNPDYIFVALGTNDSSNNVPLGNYDYDSQISDLSESQFIPAYIKGVKSLLENYPNTAIVLLIFQMGDAYASAIENIAIHFNLQVIDVRSYYTNHNVHPNKKGMTLVAHDIVSSYIAKNVTKSIIYDISKEHGGATYSNLTDALGTYGANIPSTLRRGGMSVKYVNSDNRYVQYRLTYPTWSTNVVYWQGLEDEPTAGSDNPVKGKGVVSSLLNQIPFNIEFRLKSYFWFNGLVSKSLTDSFSNYIIRTNIIPLDNVSSIKVSADSKFRYAVCYCKNGVYQKREDFSPSAIYTEEILKDDFSQYDGVVLMLHSEDLTDTIAIDPSFAEQINFKVNLKTILESELEEVVSDGEYNFSDCREGLIKTNGTINTTDKASIYFRDFVKIDGLQNYIIKAPVSSNTNKYRIQVAFYDENKGFLRRTTNVNVFGDFSFSTLSTDYYIRICIFKADSSGTLVDWAASEYYSMNPAKLLYYYKDALGYRVGVLEDKDLELSKKFGASLSIDMGNFAQGIINNSTGEIQANPYYIYYGDKLYVSKGSMIKVSIPKPENSFPDLRFALATWSSNDTYIGRNPQLKNYLYTYDYVAEQDMYVKILVGRARILDGETYVDDPRPLSPSDVAGYYVEVNIGPVFAEAKYQNALISYKLQNIFNDGYMVSDNEYLGGLVSSMDFDNNGNCYLGMLNNRYRAKEGGEPVLGIFSLNNPNEFNNYVIAPRNADLGDFGNVGGAPYDGVAKILVGTNICKCLWFDVLTPRRIGVRNFDISNKTFEEGARIIKIRIPTIVGGTWDGETFELVDATTQNTEQIRTAFNVAYGMHIYSNTEDALIINSSIVYDGTYYYNSIGFGLGTHPIMRSTDMETWEYVTEIPLSYGQSENPLFYYNGFLYTISRINYYVNRYNIANNTWDASIYLGSMDNNTARGAIAVYDGYVYVIQTIGSATININGQYETLSRGHNRIYKIDLDLTNFVCRDWITDVGGNYYVLGVHGTSLYTSVGLDRRAINRGLHYGARGGVVFNRVGYYIKDLL